MSEWALLVMLPHLAPAAGGEEHRLGVEDVQLAGGDLHCHHAARRRRRSMIRSSTWNSSKNVTLLLDALLVEGLQDHVAGAVGGVAGPAHRLLGDVVGVPAEGALGDLALPGCG